MKDYHNNSNISSQEVGLQQLTTNQTVEAIQNISKNIREYSLQMRQIMKALLPSEIQLETSMTPQKSCKKMVL